MAAIDLDDTSNCMCGHRCESCGVEREDLRVETASAARLGVMCLTLCPRCADSDVVPPVAVATAVRLVGQHCAHLGIDLDQMAAAIEAADLEHHVDQPGSPPGPAGPRGARSASPGRQDHDMNVMCECGVDAPDDLACGDPCCGRCSHPSK